MGAFVDLGQIRQFTLHPQWRCTVLVLVQWLLQDSSSGRAATRHALSWLETGITTFSDSYDQFSRRIWLFLILWMILLNSDSIRVVEMNPMSRTAVFSVRLISLLCSMQSAVLLFSFWLLQSNYFHCIIWQVRFLLHVAFMHLTVL